MQCPQPERNLWLSCKHFVIFCHNQHKTGQHLLTKSAPTVISNLNFNNMHFQVANTIEAQCINVNDSDHHITFLCVPKRRGTAGNVSAYRPENDAHDEGTILPIYFFL